MTTEIPNREKVIAYFQKHVEEKGFGAEGMDWKNQQTQDLRFHVINRYIDFDDGPSILDVGCGAGAYYPFTRAQDRGFTYTGLDIVPEMVAHVQSEFPEAKCFLGSIFEYDDVHDYAIASGTYNARLDSVGDDWQEYVFRSLTRMVDLCTKGVIINFMSPYVDYSYDRLYYPKFDELCRFIIANIGRDFVIDHDYPLYEFTLFVRK